MLAVFGLHQAARSYLGCLRSVVRFDIATICLALAFVFLSTVGAMAQNTPPIANAGPDRTVASGERFTLTGIGTDGDGTVAFYRWILVSSELPAGVPVPPVFGSAAEFSFTAVTLAPGAADAQYIFRLLVTDDDEETHTDTVTITVNAPPLANAGADATVNSGGTIPLDGTGSSDTGVGTLTYAWTRPAGATGTLTDVDTATPSFTAAALAPGAADVTHVFTLTVTDANGATNTDTVTITVVNAPPVANAGPDRTVASGERFTLTGIGTDGDGTVAFYRWILVSSELPAGVPVPPVFGSAAEFSFTAVTLAPGAADAQYIFRLLVTDDDEETHTDTVTITVNAPPLANAGADATVNSGGTIPLDGTGSSDTGVGTLTYAWTRPAGATGTLTDVDTATPSFTAAALAPGAADVTHVFTLTVTDANGATNTDTVTITVVNAPPVANAGPDRTVASGERFTLTGIGTDGDGTVAFYRWILVSSELPAGVPVPPVFGSAAEFSFTAVTLAPGAADAQYIFRLLVTDDDEETHTDTVTITVNAPPLANAGADATVNSGGTIPLDGTGSSDTGVGTLTYAWTRPAGATGTLTDVDTATPSFTAAALAPGAADVTHVFTLTVTDANGATNTDTVTITVVNAPPVANAGPDRTVASGERFTLTGIGTDGDGTVAFYRWILVSSELPAGVPVPPVFGSAAEFSFTAVTLAPGAADAQYIFRLLVTDDDEETHTDTVTITVNAPPLANAGADATVNSGGTIPLDGTGSSDTGVGTLTYAWTRPAGATGTLTDVDTATPSFTAAALAPGAADVTHVFTLTVTDANGATNTDTVTITVVNAPPVANAGPDRTVASGERFTLTGIGTDGDGTVAFYRWILVSSELPAGVPVPPVFGSAAEFSFTAVTLAPGAADAQYIFRLLVTDDDEETHTDTVTITVNAPPLANAGADATVNSGGTIPLDGTGSSDTGVGTLTYAWTRPAGATGTLTDVDTATPSFTAAALAPGAADVTHVFTLTVTDANGATNTDTVTITVVNAPPVANAGPDRTVASGERFTLTGIGTDGDGTVAFYRWILVSSELPAGVPVPPVFGSAAEFSFTAVTLAPGAADAQYIFRLLVTDDDEETHTDTVTITVNAPPLANAGADATVNSGGTIPLDGTGSSDTGVGTLTYAWTRPAGATGTLTDVDTATPSFTAAALAPGAADVTHVFTLTVTDANGATNTDTVTITVVNAPPVANAGPDRTVASGERFTLTGIGTDGDGTVAFYRWILVSSELPAGVPVPPVFGSAAEFSFTAVTLAPGAADAQYIFRLLVTDDDEETHTDTVTITVNAPPLANAGADATVNSGGTIPLDGTGSSDTGVGTLTYAWTRPAGATGTLTDVDTATPSFTAAALAPGAADVTHVFTLTVTDANGATNTDTVTITVVNAPFVPTVANAGMDQTVGPGDPVTLDGSGSTSDRRFPIGNNYAWERTGGTTGGSVELTNADRAQATFTADTLTAGAEDVTHTFTLTVTNSAGTSDTDTATITVEAPVATLEADAGEDSELRSGATVTLDGSGSMPGEGRTIATYAWTRTSGTGGSLTNADKALARFTAPALTPGAPDATHVFELTVTDDKGSTDTDTVTITVVNAPPVANAGPDQGGVRPGTTVTLDGSGSRDDDGTITYAWARKSGSGDPTVMLSDTTAIKPTFTADMRDPGSTNVFHTFELTVTDDDGATDTDTVRIVIVTPFVPLTANAGVDQKVTSGATVELDGSGSTVDDRTGIGLYSWARTGGTTGANVRLSDARVAKPTFTADTLTPGDDDVTHIFTLTVTDNNDVTDTDMVTVTVEAPETPPNRPPVACGNGGTIPYGATIASGAIYTLDASCSTDPDGNETIKNYIWRYPEGYNGETDKAAGLTERADVLAPGAPDKTLVYTLTVVDIHDARSEPVTVTFTVTAPFAPTVANAGADREVVSGTVGVELDGSGSTYDRRFPIEEYKWEWTSGTGGATEPSSLTNADMAKATFTADTLMVGDPDVTHTFTLTVTDSDGDKSTDTVTITVTAPAAPRVAAAGDDQTVAAGATVTLDGSGSTVVNGPISAYNWTRESGTSTRTTIFATDSGGTTNQREISTPTITFVADNVPANGAAVTHVIALRVFDADGIPSPKDEVTVTVNPNQLPTANAGVDRSVDSGVTVMLVGSGTDSDSDDATLTYSWAWTSGSGASVPLTDADKATASFTANTLTPGAADATHTFTLTVTDNNGESAMSTVTITVEAPLAPLVADAGEPQTVDSGDPVTLDGSGSTESVGDRTVTYDWDRTSGSSTATVTLSDRTALRPTFTADTLAVGADDVTHVFTLTVTDNQGTPEATDMVTVTIEAPDDTTAPTGVIKPVAATHDGETAITMTVDFDEPVTGFVASDITATITLPAGFPLETHGPMITNFAQDTNDASLYTFTLTPRAPLLISLSVAADAFSDEAGNPGEAGLSRQVNYTGANAPPIADAGMDQEVDSGELVELDGSGSRDIDGSIKSYQWFSGSAGAPGLTGGNTARPTFTAPVLEPGAANVVLSYGLFVTDNQDRAGDSSDTVRITVIAPIAPTVAEAGPNQTVASGALVELDGSGSTSDRRFPIGENNYAWQRTGGTMGVTAPTLTGATTAKPTFTAETLMVGDTDVTHIFTLTVTDSDGDSAEDMVTITVEAPNADPVAEAGPNQRRVTGGTVTLDGSGSMDPDGTPGEMLTYGWLRATGADEGSGDPVTLSNPAIAGPTFTAETPDAGADDDTYGFTLTVTDDDEASHEDMVTITVNAPPKADAGLDRTYAPAAPVTLEGGDSSDTTGTFTYAWARTIGADSGDAAAVTLAGANTASPTFTAEALASGAADVTYGFTLTVTDADGIEATDAVKITVTTGNLPPVADAGPNQRLKTGGLVTLDGSRSMDPDGLSGEMLTYGWARSDSPDRGNGGTVTLSVSTIAGPTFTADTPDAGAADATYGFTLTVTDVDSESHKDTVTITVNAPPKADAGVDLMQDSGTLVTLDGSGSSDTTGMFTYAWVRTTGDTVTLSDPSAQQPTFTAPVLEAGDADAEYVFTLTVTDADGVTDEDTVMVTINAPAFAALVAQAGPDQDNVASGAPVMLDGTGSTRTGGGRNVTYLWARTGGTQGGSVTLTGDTTLAPSFTADTLTAGDDDVEHIITLTVMDNQGTPAATDTVTITVKAPGFTALVAQAGPDQDNVASGAPVTLDGTGSTRTGGGRNVTYLWARTGGTQGGSVTLTGDTTLAPSFTADTLTAGDDDVEHIITLTVMDNQGTPAATDTVTITVKAPGFTALVAQAGPDQDNVASGAPVTLDGTGSTRTGGGRNVTYLWARTGGTQGGTVTLTGDTTLAPSFTADTLTAGDDDVEHIITLTVMDNQGTPAATDTVTITVKAPGFTALVAQAGPDQDNVASGAPVMLDGTGSTRTGGGRNVTYLWARTGGTQGGSVTLTGDTTLAPSFTADTLTAGDDDVEHIITLTVMDNQGTPAATDTVTITVKAPGFTALVAQAGPDQDNVASGAPVTLDGTGSTRTGGGRNVTYLWARTGGTQGGSVTLTGDTTLAPSFTADTLTAGDDDVEHIITLTVMDNQGTPAATDTVTITVKAPGFTALVAQAGPDQDNVASGAPVTLDGTGSTRTGGGRNVTYLWARTGGTQGGTVTLTGDTTLAPSFTADTLTAGDDDVEHIITLTVMDNQGTPAATDTVTITVKAPGFTALVAQAGPDQDNVASGAPVTLDGTGSTRTGGGRNVTYLWARTGGTQGGTVTLTGDTTLAPSFTADTLTAGDDDVEHIITLTVMDNQGTPAATDTVTITVTSGFADPLAIITGGDRSVASGATVQLDGSGSTHDSRTTLTYGWERTGGTGDSNLTLTGANTSQPTFTAETLTPGATAVTHILTLTVTDSEGGTDTATVTITVTSVVIKVDGSEPVGPIPVISGETVTLDGSGTDIDGKIKSWLWERIGGTGDRSDVTLSGLNTATLSVTANRADTAQTSFVADTCTSDPGGLTHIFTLTVTDNDDVTSTSAPVTVIVSCVAQVEVDISLSRSELMVQEGGSGTYQVRLGESPPQEVSIMATSGNEAVVQLKNARLVFNAGNWNDWQAVEINTVAGSSTDDPVVIRHRLVTDGVTSAVPGDVTVTLRARADDPIPAPVGQFLQTRATALINNQPGLSSLLELDGSTPGGGGGGSFTFQATDGRLAMNGGFVHNSVWGKVSGAYASSESAGGTTRSVTKSVLASFGVHRKYSEHVLAGAMLQFDLSDHDRAGQVGRTDTIDGTGWLVGPYFAVRHGSQPLYFEVRLLYGQSDNDIRFMDTGLGVMRTGSFDTRRLLAQIRVEGEIAMSGRGTGEDGGAEGPRLRPYADARWIEDRANAFTDNVNNRVPGQTVSIGQLELGSNVEIPIAVRTGAMTFTGGLGLVWSNTEGDYINSESRSHGRGEIGFSYDLDDNLRIDLDSFYDGIGTSRYEGYGLSLSAEMKF